MLDTLSLTNFRSYKDAQFKLGSGITLVVGPNASGKTNLLESIYVLASTKSFRASDRDLLNHQADFFRVIVRNGESELALIYEGSKGHKSVTHNKIKKTLNDHIGTLQAILFEPSDLELLAGPPEQRRRYLDFVLCQTDRSYLKELARYRRVLKQRNALLEHFAVGQIKDQIFVWDLKLAELASGIVIKRLQLIEHINQLAPKLYQEISGVKVHIKLKYLPSIGSSDYAEEFLTALASNLPRDLAAGFTTIGPHREDFKVQFEGSDISSVASRGETRTVVLVLKLAELAYIEKHSGQRPVLLLDDVFSELDRNRRSYLLKKLQGYQTIITATEIDPALKSLGKAVSIIKVKNHA